MKKSFYISRDNDAILNRDPHAEASDMLNRVIARYPVLVTSCTPTTEQFQDREILLLCDLMNGTALPHEAGIPAVLSSVRFSLADALYPENGYEYPDKWGVNSNTLERWDALSEGEQLAVLDIVERFWARDWREASDYATVIRELRGIN